MTASRADTRQPCLAKAGCDCSGQYPVTDRLTEEGLYLPSASGLTEDDIGYVCEKIREAI